MSSEAIVLSDHSIQKQSSSDAVMNYLASLSETSRIAQRWALQAVVDLVSDDKGKYTIFDFQWDKLTPTTLSLIRGKISKYKYTTANRILAAIRGVITSCWRLGLIDAEQKDRLLDFKPIKGRSVPAGRHVPLSELSSMQEAADYDKIVGLRDAAIIALIAGTGLRRNEVTTIDLGGYADLDGTGKSVLVLGKGNKERTVAVPHWAQQVIDEWLEKRGGEQGPLFLPIARNGKVMMRRISPSTVALAVKNLAARAGIEKNITTHDFRRTYVSNLLDAGVDLAVVQRMVGHSDPKITARYDRRGKSAERAAADLLKNPAG